MNVLVVFPTFFNLSLNLPIRSSWSEPPGMSLKEDTKRYFVELMNEYLLASSVYLD